MLKLIVASSKGDAVILDKRVRIGLACVTQQPGDAFAAKILMVHEAEALARVLEARVYDDDRISGLVDFLRVVDPLKASGWNDSRLKDYCSFATETLTQSLWLTRAFDHLDNVQAQVARDSGIWLFRTTLLKAAIAYFITQLPPEEVEPIHATG